MKSKKKQVKLALEKKPCKTEPKIQTNKRLEREDKFLKLLPWMLGGIALTIVLYFFQDKAWVALVYVPLLGFTIVGVIFIIFKKICDRGWLAKK